MGVWGGGNRRDRPKPMPKTPRPERQPLKDPRGARPCGQRAPRVCPADPKVCPKTASPPEGPASPAAAQPGSPRAAPPLVKSGAPWSLVCGRIAGVLGSPLPPRPRIFIRAHAVSLHPPSAPSFDEVSSSSELSASFRVPRPACRPSYLAEPRDSTEQPKSASHGVLFPHRGVSSWRPPFRRDSRPSGHVPSSTFLTSSTVFSANCLRGLVSSRCHVQGSPCRGLSLARSRTGFPRPVHALLALRVAAFDQLTTPSPSGLCSPPRVRCRSRRVGPRPIRAPRGLELLRVFPPRNVGMPSHPLRP